MDAPVLRPLGVGDVVDRVFNLYRGRPLLFLALAAIPYLVLFLLIGAMVLAFAGALAAIVPLLDALVTEPERAFGGASAPNLRPDIAPGAMATVGVLVLVAILAAIILLSTQSASLIEAAAARYLSRETSIGAAFRAGLVAAPRVILAGIAVFVAFVLLWLGLLVIFFVTRNAVVAIVGSLAGVVASVFLFASWLVAPVVATLERLGPIAALRRAWSLSAGHRWRILGLQLLLVILQAVVSTLISFVFIAAFIGDRTVQLVAQQLTNVLATIAWAPVEWAAFTVFYFDLRVRKEALDLQLAAEALPHETR